MNFLGDITKDQKKQQMYEQGGGGQGCGGHAYGARPPPNYGGQPMSYGQQPQQGYGYGAYGGQTHHGHQSNMKLKLSIKAKDLKNVAGMFKGTSDPYAVVTIFTYKSHNPTVLGRTETQVCNYI